MESSTILVVEDDAAVRRGVVDALTFTGYTVLSAEDGESGKAQALSARYDLLLLDLILPHFSGFEILEALKKERPGQAVIILSAKGEENDRVRGLKMGADDYVVKPFSARELLARVDAVLRRTSERKVVAETLEVQGREIDLTAGVVKFQGKEEDLSEREMGVLRYLFSNGQRAVPREELLRHVWGIETKNIETRTVDMHIAHLRRKLGDEAQGILQTVRGKGYRLVKQA
jgi:DNA-binding response OmpR family regulator